MEIWIPGELRIARQTRPRRLWATTRHPAAKTAHHVHSLAAASPVRIHEGQCSCIPVTELFPEMQECKFCGRVAMGILLKECSGIVLKIFAMGATWYQVDPCTLAVPVEVQFVRGHG